MKCSEEIWMKGFILYCVGNYRMTNYKGSWNVFNFVYAFGLYRVDIISYIIQLVRQDVIEVITYK